MTEKADKVLADRKERTRKQLEKLELEARRRANPAWPYWRKAKLQLERIHAIALSQKKSGEFLSELETSISEIEDSVGDLGPQPKADAAS